MAHPYRLKEVTVYATAPDQVSYGPRRFTVDAYYRMQEAGILTEDDRVELIDGCIVVREPASPPHASHTKRLIHLFTRLLDDLVVVSVQDPFRIDEYNHPQPDVALLRPREDFYAAEHPGPEDTILLVESLWRRSVPTIRRRFRSMPVRVSRNSGSSIFRTSWSRSTANRLRAGFGVSKSSAPASR